MWWWANFYWLGRRHRGRQHCTAVLHRAKVWSIAIRSDHLAGGEVIKETLDEQRKKAVSDRGHSRRRHRQGSGAGRAAGAGDGREKAWCQRAFRSFRLRVLGLL